MINSPDTTTLTDTEEIVASRARLLSVNTDIAAAQKNYAILMRDISRLTEEKTYLNEQCESLKNEVSELEGMKLDLNENIEKMREEKELLTEENESLRSSYEDKNAELISRENAIALKEQELAQSETKLNSAISECSELKTNLLKNKEDLVRCLESIKW